MRNIQKENNHMFVGMLGIIFGNSLSIVISMF